MGSVDKQQLTVPLFNNRWKVNLTARVARQLKRLKF